MIIIFHEVLDVHGVVDHTHEIDTLDPKFIATLAAMKAGTLDLVASGWGQVGNHRLHPGNHTMLDLLKLEAVRLNEPTIRAAFGI